MYVLTKIRKCTIAFLTAMFVALCSMHASLESVSAAGITESNTNVLYYAYNSSGAYSYQYTLNSVSLPTNTRDVIGTEDRYADNSLNGVVKIIYNDGKDDTFATGFVVGPHTIATAAHVVCNAKANTANEIYQILFFNSNGSVELELNSYKSIHVPYEYIDYTSRYLLPNGTVLGGACNIDYAVIELPNNVDLSAYCCFNLGSVMDAASDAKMEVSLTGFPAYLFGYSSSMPDAHYYMVNDIATHNKMTGSGTITELTKDNISTSADASGGNSGGPLYITTEYNGKKYYTVIGIEYGIKPEYTHCVRFNTDVLHFYKNNPHISV